jgi:hypothetical protein
MYLHSIAFPFPGSSDPFFGAYGQCKENQKLEDNREFQQQRQTVLQPNHKHQQHHRKPLPSGTAQPLKPSRKPEYSADTDSFIQIEGTVSAQKPDCEETGNQYLDQQNLSTHERSP